MVLMANRTRLNLAHRGFQYKTQDLTDWFSYQSFNMSQTQRNMAS